MGTTIASIDIGTQTIRLLVSEPTPDGALHPVHRDRRIVRLGAGVLPDRRLREDAMRRAIHCIATFADTARRYNAACIHAVATACVRNAPNAAVFLRRVQTASGLRPRVITGREEACLTLAGVQSVCPPGSGPAVVVDIGGGSTEFVLLENGSPRCEESLPLGVVALAESLPPGDPPPDPAIVTLSARIGAVIESESRVLQACAQLPSPPALIATAGTATTLAAMDCRMTAYEPERINGHCITRATLERMRDRMCRLPQTERARLPGLEPERAQVIIPGTVLLLEIMQRCRCRECMVSDAGLLEGVLCNVLRPVPLVCIPT